MKRFFPLNCGVLLVLASTCIADLPPPPGIGEVTPRIRLAGADKFPDHVFYVSFKTGRLPNTKTAKPLLFEVKNADPVTLKGNQRIIFEMYVLALDRKDFEKRKTADDTLAWLTPKAEGVLAASVTAPPTYGNVKDKEVPVTEYTVEIKDGKLKATSPAPKTKGTTELSPEERPLRPWIVAVALVLSLALFGVWFARRRPGV